MMINVDKCRVLVCHYYPMERDLVQNRARWACEKQKTPPSYDGGVLPLTITGAISFRDF